MARTDDHQDGFLPRVEALRGVAALIVANFHVTLLTGLTGDGMAYQHAYASGGWEALAFKIYMATANGFGSVIAFFVISGFVLARSLDRSIERHQRWLSRYVVSRIFRLFPAAICVVALFTLLYYWFGINVCNGSYEPLNVLLNMLMLRTDIDAVMWSMRVELIATPIILVAVLALKRHGVRPVLVLAAVLFGLSFVVWIDKVLVGGKVGPLYAFVIGVLTHFYGAELAARIGSRRASFFGAVAIGVFALCGVINQTPWLAVLQVISAALIIILIVWRMPLALFQPLDLPIIRFYGRISYSFYLLHPLTLWIMEATAQPYRELYQAGVPLVLIVTVLSIISIAAITPLAYLSWRYVEVPCVALGRLAFSTMPSQTLDAVARGPFGAMPAQLLESRSEDRRIIRS